MRSIGCIWRMLLRRRPRGILGSLCVSCVRRSDETESFGGGDCVSVGVAKVHLILA